MNKRTDIQIFEIGHKPLDYGFWENSLYTPIQVGDGEDMLPNVLRDIDGTNIHEWNFLFAETCATMWIANNVPDLKYIGQCQYRRRIEFPEDENFDELFDRCDVVATEPIENCNPWLQYSWCHSEKDMIDLKEIFAEEMPAWLQPFEKHIETGTKIFYSNSFIMRAEDYREYAAFVMRVFEALRIKRGWDTPEACQEQIKSEVLDGSRHNAHGLRYVSQIMGFLSERLWTMWVQSKFERVCLVPYKKYENLI